MACQVHAVLSYTYKLDISWSSGRISRASDLLGRSSVEKSKADPVSLQRYLFAPTDKKATKGILNYCRHYYSPVIVIFRRRKHGWGKKSSNYGRKKPIVPSIGGRAKRDNYKRFLFSPGQTVIICSIRPCSRSRLETEERGGSNRTRNGMGRENNSFEKADRFPRTSNVVRPQE